MGVNGWEKMERRAFLIVMVAFCAAACAAAATARADVATIGASKDNTIFQSNVNNSLGAGQAIFAGNSGQSSPRRGLIDFDIAGSIPAGSTINSVQMTLYLNSVAGGSTGSPTIHLYRLSNDWGEGSAGSAVNGASGVGQGLAAGEGDATWNARHFSATMPTLWNTTGGDFAAADSAALAIVGTTLNTSYTWGSTAGMVADVQSWLNDPSTNFGWSLVGDEGSASTVRGFWTREAARTGQGAFVPQLQVTYTAVPEPAALMLVLAGSLLGIRRRGR
jgi:hypothetical protein